MIRLRAVSFAISFALPFALAGCGSECPDGDLTTTSGGLSLTEAEHPDGWGNPDCVSCHALAALHRTSCAEDVNLAEVRDIVATDGVASCSACHGDNGVPQ